MHEYDREQLKEYTNTVTEIENLQKTLEEEQKESGSNGKKSNEAEQATLNRDDQILKKDEITNLDGNDPGSCKEKAERGTKKQRKETPQTGRGSKETMMTPETSR